MSGRHFHNSLNVQTVLNSGHWNKMSPAFKIQKSACEEHLTISEEFQWVTFCAIGSTKEDGPIPP